MFHFSAVVAGDELAQSALEHSIISSPANLAPSPMTQLVPLQSVSVGTDVGVLDALAAAGTNEVVVLLTVVPCHSFSLANPAHIVGFSFSPYHFLRCRAQLCGLSLKLRLIAPNAGFVFAVMTGVEAIRTLAAGGTLALGSFADEQRMAVGTLL